MEFLEDGQRLFDISPLVSEDIAIFPGDQPFRRTVSHSFEHGDTLTLSAITTSLHVGAHTDAPNHYHARGKSIAERPLSYYIGPCQVVDVSERTDERIRWEDITTPVTCKRILFKTDSFPDPNCWLHDFAYLCPDLITQLATLGVKLVGIDTPSIDPSSSKDLEAHARVFAHDMAILEGIVLNEVPPGVYELIALPLRLDGADASPVRAILRGH